MSSSSTTRIFMSRGFQDIERFEPPDRAGFPSPFSSPGAISITSSLWSCDIQPLCSRFRSLPLSRRTLLFVWLLGDTINRICRIEIQTDHFTPLAEVTISQPPSAFLLMRKGFLSVTSSGKCSKDTPSKGEKGNSCYFCVYTCECNRFKGEDREKSLWIQNGINACSFFGLHMFFSLLLPFLLSRIT